MKNILKSRKQRGFTIIEILIVLTIAGLILAIVFIAVPQLQRNARDNQRQSMAGRLSTELDTYASNNQGTFPFANVPAGFVNCTTLPAPGCNDWYGRYINGIVNTKDPKTGGNITINIGTTTTLPVWVAANAYISVGNKCLGEGIQAGSGGGANAKSYALLIALERTNTYYCVDNG